MNQETIRKLAERIGMKLLTRHPMTDRVDVIAAELATFGALLEAAEGLLEIKIRLDFEGLDQVPYIYGLDKLVQAKTALRAALSDIQKQ